MTDPRQKARSAALGGELDLTQTIRRLSVPIVPAHDLEGEALGTALLLCRDSESRKWGRRWLSQAGLVVEVPEPSSGLAAARQMQPAVILVEAGVKDDSGAPVYRAISDAADVHAPVIVLCASSKEAAAAAEADVHDVVRKPFQWPTISRRAHHAARLASLEARLEESNENLVKAIKLADAARQQLRSREAFEPVTGLPNKAKFVDLLGRSMVAVQRDGNELAVIVIGFTRFPLLIEAMGQEQADRVLTEIGQNLSTCLRQARAPQRAVRGLRTAAAGSLDQFRFAVMLTCSDAQEELASLHKSLLETLSRPIQVAGQTVYPSACLGIALYPQDAETADSLLQRADNAMRDAHSRGGGFKYYCAETDAAAARKLRIEHMLHEALERDELRLAYQPINNVTSGKVIAAEALLRWPQEDGSQISPAEFVPIAEESGLMLRIGEFVLEEACRQIVAWDNQGVYVPHISVNVARVQLISEQFVTAVRRTLDRHQLDPQRLELEISERGVLAGNYGVIAQLEELNELGVRLSLDDFGTGDSAIAYLKELPIDVLKIDRSYIAGLTANRKDEAIASAMIALGQRLGLEVVAEGVETDEQLAILRQLDCQYFQGFLVSEAVEPDAFAALLGAAATAEPPSS